MHTTAFDQDRSYLLQSVLIDAKNSELLHEANGAWHCIHFVAIEDQLCQCQEPWQLWGYSLNVIVGQIQNHQFWKSKDWTVHCAYSVVWEDQYFQIIQMRNGVWDLQRKSIRVIQGKGTETGMNWWTSQCINRWMNLQRCTCVEIHVPKWYHFYHY